MSDVDPVFGEWLFALYHDDSNTIVCHYDDLNEAVDSAAEAVERRVADGHSVMMWLDDHPMGMLALEAFAVIGRAWQLERQARA